MTLAANTYVYDSARADIDGDRTADEVVLYGEKQENDNPYVQNIATTESVWTVSNGHLKLLSEKIIPIDQ